MDRVRGHGRGFGRECGAPDPALYGPGAERKIE